MKALFSSWLGLQQAPELPEPLAPWGSDSVWETLLPERTGLPPVTERVSWAERAASLGATPIAPATGRALWADCCRQIGQASDGLARLGRHLTYAWVPANRELIRQDEEGSFLLVQLDGLCTVDRVQPWGEHLRLAETRAGDILGEMSLLDGSARFSACTSLSDCTLAVLTRETLTELESEDPLALAALMALLARRLAHRLRVVSARLSAQPLP